MSDRDLFSTEVLPANDSLQDSHDLVLVTPFDDASLAFKLMLPKGWVSEEDVGEQQGGIGHLVRIGLFAEKVSADAAIVQVSFSRIPLEINVLDWVRFQAEKSGVELIFARHCEFVDGLGVEAGGFAGPPNKRHVVRIVAIADSARIFLVMGMVPQALHEKRKLDIAIATHSFRLRTPTGSALLEHRLAITVPNPDFTVDYPASWEPTPVEEQVAGKSGINLRLINDGKMLAFLRVKAVEAAIADAMSLVQWMDDANRELAEGDIRMATLWEQDQDPSIATVMDSLGTFVAKGRTADSDLELRLGIVNRNEMAFAITLISMTREIDKVLWMRSKRAYEIALASVEPE